MGIGFPHLRDLIIYVRDKPIEKLYDAMIDEWIDYPVNYSAVKVQSPKKNLGLETTDDISLHKFMALKKLLLDPSLLLKTIKKKSGPRKQLVFARPFTKEFNRLLKKGKTVQSNKEALLLKLLECAMNFNETTVVVSSVPEWLKKISEYMLNGQLEDHDDDYYQEEFVFLIDSTSQSHAANTLSRF